MSGSQGQQKLDDLIAESRRIQDALIRVVVKLDIFADQLSKEAAKLQQATGVEDGRISDGEAPAGLGSGRPSDAQGRGTDHGNGGGES